MTPGVVLAPRGPFQINGLLKRRFPVGVEVQREGGPLKAAETLFDNGGGAVILTDWDNKGDAIASDLEYHMKALGVRYDRDIRERLRRLCQKDIKDIESLDSLYGRLSSDA